MKIKVDPGFQDALYEAYERVFSEKEALEKFKELPHHIQCIAYEWGMGDTVFRDYAYEYFIKMKNNVC